MNTATENKNKYTALALTIGFHIVLFIVFVFVVFVTPIPPFEIKPLPEIEIGLGFEGYGNTDPGGSGKNDPDVATSPPESTESQTVTDNDAPNIVTDDNATEVSVNTSPDNVTTKSPEAPEVVEQKPSSELAKALAAMKNKKRHSGAGDGGKDTGGSGTGDNGGIGGKSGTGHGNNTPGGPGGGGFDLRGRMLLKKPARMAGSKEEGIVVVEIIVDQYGKVIKATPGRRGSTTTSSNLYAKATQAAYSVKFNPSPEGIKEQRGTYTFVFLLQ